MSLCKTISQYSDKWNSPFFIRLSPLLDEKARYSQVIRCQDSNVLRGIRNRSFFPRNISRRFASVDTRLISYLFHAIVRYFSIFFRPPINSILFQSTLIPDHFTHEWIIKWDHACIYYLPPTLWIAQILPSWITIKRAIKFKVYRDTKIASMPIQLCSTDIVIFAYTVIVPVSYRDFH